MAGSEKKTPLSLLANQQTARGSGEYLITVETELTVVGDSSNVYVTLTVEDMLMKKM